MYREPGYTGVPGYPGTLEYPGGRVGCSLGAYLESELLHRDQLEIQAKAGCASVGIPARVPGYVYPGTRYPGTR
eukprot:683305-Rhodomonas_salina.1